MKEIDLCFPKSSAVSLTIPFGDLYSFPVYRKANYQCVYFLKKILQTPLREASHVGRLVSSTAPPTTSWNLFSLGTSMPFSKSKEPFPTLHSQSPTCKVPVIFMVRTECSSFWTKLCFIQKWFQRIMFIVTGGYTRRNATGTYAF